MVEAAFLAHAFIRASQGLWYPLAQDTKDRVIKEFKGLRRVQPFESNWLLFAAIVEAFLYSVGEKDIAQERIDKAVHKFDKECMSEMAGTATVRSSVLTITMATSSIVCK